MKKHPKHQKIAETAEKKLPLLAKDIQTLLTKHGLENARLTGIEMRLHEDPIGVSAVAPAVASEMSGCVVLPGGVIWCG